MFTGIIEEMGTITALEPMDDSLRLTVSASTVLTDVALGASISVSGVCLTVTSFTSTKFTADVMAETLRHSALAHAAVGDRVNLERAMAADGRFGGHIVQGHVDGTTVLVSRQQHPQWEVLTFALPPSVAPYVVHKGSITIDGTSLTVSERTKDTFSVSLIPTTLSDTTLGGLAVGHTVNVEADVLAKYVASMLAEGADVRKDHLA